MSQERNLDDRVLQHFAARSANPSNYKNAKPVKLIVVSDGNMGDGVDYGKAWVHVGTSPQLSPVDRIQARSRMQTLMKDS